MCLGKWDTLLKQYNESFKSLETFQKNIISNTWRHTFNRLYENQNKA